jgi:Rrf2 family protein
MPGRHRPRHPRRAGSPVRIREIADAQGIPESFLTQILLKLKAAGFVQSTRGGIGRYRLARPADRISLGEIVHTIDGDEAVSRELIGPAGPVLAQVWGEIRETQLQVLSGTSIGQLARRASPADWVI